MQVKDWRAGQGKDPGSLEIESFIAGEHQGRQIPFYNELTMQAVQAQVSDQPLCQVQAWHAVQQGHLNLTTQYCRSIVSCWSKQYQIPSWAAYEDWQLSSRISLVLAAELPSLQQSGELDQYLFEELEVPGKRNLPAQDRWAYQIKHYIEFLVDLQATHHILESSIAEATAVQSGEGLAH